MLGNIVTYNGAPAIIVKVNDNDTVNLQAFNDGNSISYFPNVPNKDIEIKKEV